jgi:hypothetical protein
MEIVDLESNTMIVHSAVAVNEMPGLKPDKPLYLVEEAFMTFSAELWGLAHPQRGPRLKQ